VASDLVLFCGFGDLLAQSILNKAWFSDITSRNFTIPQQAPPAMKFIERRDEEINWPARSTFDETDILDFVNRWIERRAPQERYFVLVIVLSDEQLRKRVKNSLDPWVGIAPLETRRFPEAASRLNQVRNELQREVRDLIRHYAKKANILGRHLFESKRRTPLLLPDEKTRSKIVPVLRRIHEYSGSDIQGEIERAIRNFDQERYVSKSEKTPKRRQRFYEINGFIFKCPAGDGHGWQRQPGCRPDCFLRSRLRLGVSIDPQFHYDCISADATLPSTFSSCHGQTVQPGRARTKGYVNISPNDFVR
jgi:hypothetical protein